MPPATVLIVEDDPVVRDALYECLTDLGHRVIAAPDGEAALAILRAGPLPSLALVDLRMPGLSGEQLVLELRRDPALASLPVVIVSAERDARSVASRLGVDGVLTKPIDVDALLALVAQHSG